MLELFLTIQVRNNAVACLQAKPRPRRHARQSSTQTLTSRRWELEVWTRNSLTFSVELLHPESFPLTLWSRWVNILAHLSPYFVFFARKIVFMFFFILSSIYSLFSTSGCKHVKGILLFGPPGCGKTLMARQIGKMLNAREPKVVNGPEILNKYVGESEANIRKLFAEAEEEQKRVRDVKVFLQIQI